MQPVIWRLYCCIRQSKTGVSLFSSFAVLIWRVVLSEQLSKRTSAGLGFVKILYLLNLPNDLLFNDMHFADFAGKII